LSNDLAARVTDPLWLLARQWQVGEFVGRNTGSPLTAQVGWTTAAFDRYQSGTAAVLPYDGTRPIETLIEQEAVRPQTAANDLEQAVEAGLQFFRLLDAANLTHLRPAYLGHYPLTPSFGKDADSQQIGCIVAGRVIDGIQLRADLGRAPDKLPALPALSAADSAAVIPVAKAWISWFDSSMACSIASHGPG
jgi:hypothetical protein